jgi:hypothetical protein
MNDVDRVEAEMQTLIERSELTESIRAARASQASKRDASPTRSRPSKSTGPRANGDVMDDYHPASREAPRPARRIAMDVRREQERRLGGWGIR